MNNNERIAANWRMVECLAKEVCRDMPVEWHEGPMLEQLLHWYASRDERFRFAGFQWSQPDGFILYCPKGAVPCWYESRGKFRDWRHEKEEWYVGEAAMAAFLGLEVRSEGFRMKPTVPSLSTIYKHFASAPEAIDWIHRRTAKEHGMRTAEYDKVATDEWPFIHGGRVSTTEFLIVPSIKQQLAGDKSCATGKKD